MMDMRHVVLHVTQFRHPSLKVTSVTIRTARQPSSRRRARLAGALGAVLLLIPNPALANGTPEQLDNEKLAFGGIPTNSVVDVNNIPAGPLSAAASVLRTSGMLDSPYYKSTVDGLWYPMTYNGSDASSGQATIPLSFGLGIGRYADEDADTFHKNTVVAVSQIGNNRESDDANTGVITGVGVAGVVDQNGVALSDNNIFTVTRTAGAAGRGAGTITAVGYLKFTEPGGLGGASRILKVTHAYTLGANNNFLEAVSTFQNVSASPALNVNFWVGTSDDWIGTDYRYGDGEEDKFYADSPSQRKGLIQGGAFRAVCEGPTNAVITFSPREYTLLYSNADGAQGLLTDNINSFESSVNDAGFTNSEGNPYESIIDLDPSTTEDEILEADSAVGLYLPIGDLAANEAKSVTWYIEGGSLDFEVQDCNAPVTVASLPAGPQLVCTPDPVAVGGTVTVAISGADANGEFLWNARYGTTRFAGAAVRSAADGTGTFTFQVPAGARGLPVTAELVDWNSSCVVTVAGTATPTRLPAGEGPNAPLPGLLVLAGLLGAATVAGRLRVRSER